MVRIPFEVTGAASTGESATRNGRMSLREDECILRVLKLSWICWVWFEGDVKVDSLRCSQRE
jgi:hypothetical protein